MPIDMVGVDLSHRLGDAEIHELGHAPFVEETPFTVYGDLIGSYLGSLDHSSPLASDACRPCWPARRYATRCQPGPFTLQPSLGQCGASVITQAGVISPF